MKTKWLFFDIGSTLVDETAAYDRRAREMIQGTTITFADFDQKRRELAVQGFDGNAEAIKYFGLRKTPWPSDAEIPYEGAVETLELLIEKGYCLGIIANQPPGAADRLQRWGFLNFFEVIASSAELGISKPNREIFEIALALAKCNPGDSIMVGDRLDNDIRPAKALGMQTIWIRNGLAKLQDVVLGDGIADWVVDNLSELTEIL